MNMENYDKDVWMLHRKLFHHYVKYFKYFKAATEALPEYQRLLKEEEAEEKEEEEEEDKAAAPAPATTIIDLISSSSEEVSPDEDNGAESEATWDSESD